MKKLLSLVLATVMAVAVTTTAWAGTWKQDSTGWWYQNDDGSYQNNGWFQDKDGTWYYFNAAGYMLSNTTTPDGFTVNASGAWVQGGASQTTSSASTGITGENAALKTDLINKVNDYRASNGLAALTVDDQLMTFAQKRADEIVTDFSHDKWVDGYPYANANNRTEDLGIIIGDDASSLVSMWVNDPPHRQDLLNGATNTGLGVTKAGDKTYVVRVACRPQ